MQLDSRDIQVVQKYVDIGIYGDNPNINTTLSTNKYELNLLFRVVESIDVLKGTGSNIILNH